MDPKEFWIDDRNAAGIGELEDAAAKEPKRWDPLKREAGVEEGLIETPRFRLYLEKKSFRRFGQFYLNLCFFLVFIVIHFLYSRTIYLNPQPGTQLDNLWLDRNPKNPFRTPGQIYSQPPSTKQQPGSIGSFIETPVPNTKLLPSHHQHRPLPHPSSPPPIYHFPSWLSRTFLNSSEPTSTFPIFINAISSFLNRSLASLLHCSSDSGSQRLS